MNVIENRELWGVGRCFTYCNAREQLQHLSMGEPAGAPRLALGLIDELSHIHERGLAARSSRWNFGVCWRGQMRSARARADTLGGVEYKLS